MATTEAEKHRTYYHVYVDGEAIEESAVREVVVHNYLNLPDVCQLTHMFANVADLDKAYDIGAKLEVKIGARNDMTTTSVFEGEIVTLEPEFKGSVELAVRAYDRAHRLHRTRHVRSFQDMTASDIVGKVLEEAGFDSETDASGAPYKYMQQDNETDWDFIWRLARRIGFEFYVRDGKGHFVRPKAEPVAELEWGTSLHAFRPRVTAVGQVETVSVNGFSPSLKEAVTADSTTPNQIAKIGIDRNGVRDKFSGAAVHVSSTVVEDNDEATVLAQALLDRYANAYVQVQGVADGNPRIRAGTVVTIKSVGAKFSGDYRVDQTKHVLRGGGMYITEFFNLPAATISEALGSANGGRPTVGSQVMVGIVTNVNDPDSMGRVRVSIPSLGSDNESAWARVAVPAAGAERGLMMLPVLDEEVLVAFEHGDTRRPYVIGSLFNGTDVPGAELADTENGGFAVRSDDKVFMRSKKAMTISSDDTLTVEIQKEVSETFNDNQTTSVMKTLSIKAQSITIDGQTSIDIKAPTITMDAQASLSLKGATIDITGQGPTTVKGNPIMLN